MKRQVLVIEPFYGGSHKQLIDTVFSKQCDSNITLCTLPSKKWHWRARTSALTFAQLIPSVDDHNDHHLHHNHYDHDQCHHLQVHGNEDDYENNDSDQHEQQEQQHIQHDDGVVEKPEQMENDLVNTGKFEKYPNLLVKPHSQTDILFTSSVLNLTELLALRPKLQNFRKVVYFHENQLQYPVRKFQHRDFQYGYNQILSCLVADEVVFNSHYNKESFINAIPRFLKLIPDQRPDAGLIVDQIKPKCRVIYFAMCYPELPFRSHERRPKDGPLHIVWPHRWEHDKDPELFFEVIESLHAEGFKFCLSVLGEQFEDNPDIFEKSMESLKDHIKYWGYQQSKQTYYNVLQESHVVVSTAKHEFFGVAMLEAVYCGCYPIAPNALVYPEHFPAECLYNTKAQLAKKLRYFCRYPEKTRQLQIDVLKYSWERLKPQYEELLGCTLESSPSQN